MKHVDLSVMTRETPRLVFAMGEGGKLKLTCFGPAVHGVEALDFAGCQPCEIIDQLRGLYSKTGHIEVELPGERSVRDVTVGHLTA